MLQPHKTKEMFFWTQRFGYPVPCEHTFRGYDDVFAVWLDDLQEGLPIGVDVAVNPDFTSGIEYADIHFFGMQVDSAIKFVLFGVKSHWVSSFGLCLWFWGKSYYTIS